MLGRKFAWLILLIMFFTLRSESRLKTEKRL